MSRYDDRIKDAIKAEFHMISGSHDAQTSADVSNVKNQFELPDPAGRAGGACTSALLQVLYAGGRVTAPMSWVQCLRSMRRELNRMGYDQIPQLTSSRLVDVNDPMHMVPPGSTGRRRALLIGINYVGQKGQLSGCHNDVHNIKKYLIQAQGFNEGDMLILMDDGKHNAPTRRNIEEAFRRMVEFSQAGDVVFVHYSGHGGQVRDYSGDEDDGYDETLVPVDFKSAGQIVDDEILKILVKPMRAGVNCTVLMDCCHSGTVLDLPYRFSADDTKMRLDPRMNMEKYLGGFDVQTVMCCAMLGMLVMDLMSEDN